MWASLAIGGAVLGAGASIYAGNKQSDAAQNALAFSQQVYGRNQENIKPYLDAGTSSLTRIAESYQNPGSFMNTPDYKFGRAEGMDALQNSAASRGGMLSGNFLRRADQFGTDYAYNYLDRYRAGNMNIANMGANAAAGGNANATAMGGQIGQQYNYLGGANASGAVGAANAFTGGAQNYLLMNALNRSSYSGGGAWPAGPSNAPSYPNPQGGSWFE